MDINLLVLNAGNSRLAIGVFLAGELTYVSRVGHHLRAEWPARIKEAWEKLADAGEVAVVGATVNPPIVELLEHAVEQAAGRRVLWVGRDIELPIKVLTDEPGETGVDRVLNVAAAYEQMGKGCVVVDAGSAVTVDVCNDEGSFLGGAIAPGLSMQLDALEEKTAKLPRVAFEPPQSAVGKNTADAIRLGVFHGIRGLVRDLTETYATDLGFWPDVIATGGDAPKLFEGWELVHAIAPDLTLYGIALAYTNHHIKNDEA